MRSQTPSAQPEKVLFRGSFFSPQTPHPDQSVKHNGIASIWFIKRKPRGLKRPRPSTQSGPCCFLIHLVVAQNYVLDAPKNKVGLTTRTITANMVNLCLVVWHRDLYLCCQQSIPQAVCCHTCARTWIVPHVRGTRRMLLCVSLMRDLQKCRFCTRNEAFGGGGPLTLRSHLCHIHKHVQYWLQILWGPRSLTWSLKSYFPIPPEWKILSLPTIREASVCQELR